MNTHTHPLSPRLTARPRLGLVLGLVLGIVLGIAASLLTALLLLGAPAWGQSRLSGAVGATHLAANGNGDWGRWGPYAQVHYRVGADGHLGLYVAHYFDNGAWPLPSREGGALAGSLTPVMLSYDYLAPTQGRVRPRFGLSLGAAFGSELYFEGAPGQLGGRLLVERSFTGASFRLPLGAVMRLSELVQLDAGFALQAFVLTKQAQLAWPFTLGLRVGGF